MSFDSDSLAFVMPSDLLRRNQPLGEFLRWGMRVRRREAHANFEPGSTKDPTERVDGWRPASGLVCRHCGLAGTGSLREYPLGQPGLPAGDTDQMPGVRLSSHVRSIPVPV